MFPPPPRKKEEEVETNMKKSNPIEPKSGHLVLLARELGDLLLPLGVEMRRDADQGGLALEAGAPVHLRHIPKLLLLSRRHRA